MGWQEYIGTVGSFLMFSTFWMKTMIPLRVAGITANCAMIVYASSEQLDPILIMQCLMFPLNIYRLTQIRRLVRRVAVAAEAKFRPDALIPFMKKEKYADGEVLFRADDKSDKMYLIREGAVHLEEVDVTLGPGSLLGEIGIVSPHNRRTATAVCEGKTMLFSIDREDVRQLFFQEPEFGFFLIELVTERLLGNLQARQAT